MTFVFIFYLTVIYLLYFYNIDEKDMCNLIYNIYIVVICFFY